ncbi:MAG TPA: FAD-binding oxidoreductase [Streptosporangiaceae bacterium]
MAPARAPITPDGIPAELTSACPDIAVARESDAVAGRPARFVAAPASTAEAAALLAAAAGLGLTVVARGSGSRLGWGGPPASCDLIVDTRNLDQIVEHAAGDLVVTAQAGVRLDELAKTLASANQRLAVDQPADPAHGAGTVGGLIATGATGPLRYRYGAPRDLLIGITVVRADGTVAHSGGKVVKNVAGYDLGKLFAGSYGTLGLITQATFRLHPLPAATRVLELDCPDPAASSRIVQMIADSPLTPAAIELYWPDADSKIGVAVLLEGDEASVADRAERMQALVGANGQSGLARRDGEVSDAPVAAGPFRLVRQLAGVRERAGTTVRVAFWVAHLPDVLTVLRTAAAECGLGAEIGGSAGAGVLNVWVGERAPADAVVRFVAAVRAGLEMLRVPAGPPSVASAVVVSAPAEVTEAIDVWGPVPSLGLMQGVKDQFDPEHRLAPGRFVGGI